MTYDRMFSSQELSGSNPAAQTNKIKDLADFLESQSSQKRPPGRRWEDLSLTQNILPPTCEYKSIHELTVNPVRI
jgi:hypothetical protein